MGDGEKGVVFDNMNLLLAVLSLCVTIIAASTTEHTAVRLRVEYLESPLGIDVEAPRFSYALSHPSRAEAQTLFQIVVVLSSNVTVWDSGKVASNRTTNIVYAGASALSSVPCQQPACGRTFHY